jgi:hypothetical protein
MLANIGTNPYDWSCSLITVKGSEVIELFQNAADVSHSGGGGHPTGAFGLVSKEVQHTIDYTTRGDGADDITRGVTRELIINGVTFVHDLVPTTDAAILNKTYRVATLEYILLGSDDFDYYETFKKGTNRFATKVGVAFCMAHYVYDQDMVPMVPVLDGRIKLIGGVVIP